MSFVLIITLGCCTKSLILLFSSSLVLTSLQAQIGKPFMLWYYFHFFIYDLSYSFKPHNKRRKTLLLWIMTSLKWMNIFEEDRK